MTADTLNRSLTPTALFAISFGSIVGIGWITLVGEWLHRAGPAGSAVAFAVGCLCVLPIALAYAEVALLIPTAGGEVAYADRVFGPTAAFLVGWVLLLTYAAIISFQMISVGWVASTIWPPLRGGAITTPMGVVYGGELAIGLAMMGILSWVNIRATSLAASLQIGLVILKIGVSSMFIAAALAKGEAAHLEPAFGADAAGPVEGGLWVFAVSLLFFSGFNFLPQAIEERAPDVTPAQIVRAMIASLVLACVFYVLVILGTAMTLSRGQFEGLDLPAAAAFEVAFGSRTLRNVVLLAGLTGLFSSWNGTLFAASRMALMLGRKGLLPAAIARVSSATQTPYVAIWSVSALSTVMGLAGRAAVGPIVSVAAACIPLAWAVVAAAALILRFREPDAPRPYRVAWGVPLFGLSLVVSLFSFAIAARDAVLSPGLKMGALVLGGWVVAGIALRLVSLTRSRQRARAAA